VSAFITQGVSQRAFQLALLHHDICLSKYILDELTRKLDRKFKFPTEETNAFAAYLEKVSIMLKLRGKAKKMSRDPKDDAILQTAVQGHCDVLVTGDRDILDLADRLSFRVVIPRKFLELHVSE